MRKQGVQMRYVLALIGSILAGSADAAPMTLICSGSFTLEGKQSNIDRETAILDLENKTFKPPLYPEYPLTRVGENDITYGTESSTISLAGSLDRISGSLSLNVMTPADRKTLAAGGSVKFIAWMTGKCSPAKRMF